jgi:hypothetical protein
MSQSLIIRKTTGSSLTVVRNGASSGGSYTLLPATAGTLGGVKIGSGVAVDGTGVITVTASGIGLGSVDNTSDLAKPISTATQTALDAKLSTASAASTYALQSTTISPGTGLTGGGSLATSRTLSLANTTVTSGAYGSATQTGFFEVDSQGRLVSAGNILITPAWSSITGKPTFATVATSGSYADLSGKPDLSVYLTTSTAAATYATISSLSSYLTTATAAATYALLTRTITAGTGLSGGGDLSANRTLSLAASGVTAGSYGSQAQSVTLAIDTYGRITAAQQQTIYVDWNAVSGRPPITESAGTALYSGAANLADFELIRAKLKDYSETRATPVITSNTLTLNLETANFFAVNLDSNISTLTITNPPASGSVGSFTLELTADGTARTINWGSIKWPGGTPPTPTSANGKRDVLVFYTSDAGANWYGLVGGQNL